MKDAYSKKETTTRPTASTDRSHNMAGYFSRLIPVNNQSIALMTISNEEAERIIAQGYAAARSGFGSSDHRYKRDVEKKTYWLIGYGKYLKEQDDQTSKKSKS